MKQILIKVVWLLFSSSITAKSFICATLIKKLKMEQEKNDAYKDTRQCFIDSFKKPNYNKNDLRYFLFYYNKPSNYYRYFW